MLSLCLCVHNPNASLFTDVLAAVAAQTARPAFDVLLIDNASDPPLPDALLAPLRTAGLSARIVREERPGLIHARLRAIAEFSGAWMLCVDDDNILAPDYVAEGLVFIAANRDIGAFGGRLLLPPDLRVPFAARPFLPYLAVKDLGDAPLSGVSSIWEKWEPPAAGAFIARPVLEDFARFVRDNPRAAALGRAPGALASCEDSLLMHSASRLGLATAYNPRLRLFHRIDPARLESSRLIALLEAYGRSHALLDLLLRGRAAPPAYYKSPPRVAATMLAASMRHFFPSPVFGYARARYHLAAARAHREIAAIES